MRMTNTMVVSLVILAIVFIVSLAAGAIYDQYSKTEIAKACVSSGGEWVRDLGAYYKCVK